MTKMSKPYFTYTSRCCGLRLVLGLASNGETQHGSLIAGLLVERKAELYAERTERGHPPGADAHGSSKIAEIKAFAERIAHVEEGNAAQSVLFGNWK
jgi:hypothetical protein